MPKMTDILWVAICVLERIGAFLSDAREKLVHVRYLRVVSKQGSWKTAQTSVVFGVERPRTLDAIWTDKLMDSYQNFPETDGEMAAGPGENVKWNSAYSVEAE